MGGTGGEVLSGELGRGASTSPAFLIDWSAAGHGDRRENIGAYVQRYDTAGGVTLSGASPTGAAVDFDTEGNLVGADYFYAVADSGGTTRIKVNVAGWYKIMYTVIAEATLTNGRTCLIGVTKNGGAFSSREAGLDSAIYNRHTNRPLDSGSATFSVLLAADDYIEVVGISVGSATGTTDTYVKNSLGSHIRVELERDLAESSMGIRIPPREGRIDRMVIAKAFSGTSGSTTIDVKKNGTSILTAAVSISQADQTKRVGATAFSDRFVTVEDVLTVEVSAVETPPARDLYVGLWCVPD